MEPITIRLNPIDS